MQGSRDQHSSPRRRLSPPGHQHRFRGSRGAVVDRRIGNFHSVELANQRLLFEQRLQRALTYLRQIARVGSGELRARNDSVHRAWYEMMEEATTEKQAPVGGCR